MSARKLLLQFAKPYPHWVILTIVLGFSGALFNGVSTTLIVPLVLGFLGQNEDVSSSPQIVKLLMSPFLNLPENQRLLLMTTVVILIIVLKNSIVYFGLLVSSILSRSVVADLRSEGVRLLLEVDLDYYSKVKIGDIINQLSGEVTRTATAINAIIHIFTNTVTIFGFIIFLIALSWQLTLICTVFLFVVYKVNQYFINRSQKAGQVLSQASASYSTRLLEMLNGIRLVKASCSEDIEYQKLLTLIKRREQADFQAQANYAIISPLNEMLTILVVMSLIVIGRFFFSQTMNNFTTVLLTYLFLLFRMLPLISQVNSGRSRLASNIASINIIDNFLKRFELITEPVKQANHYPMLLFAGPHLPSVNYLDENPSQPPRIKEVIWHKPFMKNGDIKYQKLRDQIEFNNVSFAYPGHDHLILQNVNLCLPKGTTLALVGSSGSGKSTLADLLPRFYDPTLGKITIDGVNLSDLDIRSLRQAMGIVSQDTFLFNASVRNNIAYAKPEATEAEIIEVAKRANAYEFIVDLAQGFDTQIGDRGVLLSGGQKQRLAIARALLQNPEILILDEATSALDTVSEKLVQLALEELSRERTTLIIAHRLSTIKNADQIAVLEKGKVVETGTHIELLEKESYYARLYSMQFAEELARDETLIQSSYEVRSRLNPMIGFLKLLVDDMVDSQEEHDELVKESYQSATRILTTIEFMENTVKRRYHN